MSDPVPVCEQNVIGTSHFKSGKHGLLNHKTMGENQDKEGQPLGGLVKCW